jgi:predicted outer membrane repeat protein
MSRIGNFSRALFVWAVIVALCVVASGRIIYVDDDATGADDGSSWPDAFHYLQHALQSAEAGDEVRVAQGTYQPDQGLPLQPPRPPSALVAQTNSCTPFQLKDGVALRGGFAGVGTDDPDARDVQRHPTVLSGDLNGNDEDDWGPWHPGSGFLRLDNSRNVVITSGTSSTLLDGLVIASAAESGVYGANASLHLTNCTFRQNSGHDGGAVLCTGGALTLSYCTFVGNAAQVEGGAISARGASLTAMQCTFLENSALIGGGAVRGTESVLSLIDCTFQHNAAPEGGALMVYEGTLELAGSTFESNMAELGGAIEVSSREPASVTGCSFTRNWAVGPGGAINSGTTPLTLDNCRFSGNIANTGGALYNSYGHVVLTASVFAGNRAEGFGGAISSRCALLDITNCTFVDNLASRGATLVLSPGNMPLGERRPTTISNCILWDKGPSSLDTTDCTVSITYSNIKGGWPGAGNIDTDPFFAKVGYWSDPADPNVVVEPDFANAVRVDGDYHLKSRAGRWDPASQIWTQDAVTSPCIDAGDPDSPTGEEPLPHGTVINMGAYGGTAEASKSPAAP